MSRAPIILAGSTVITVAGVVAIASLFFPGVTDPSWTLLAVALPVFWAVLEATQRGNGERDRAEAVRWYRLIVAWIGLAIALAFAAQLAVAAGIIAPESAPVARRLRGIVFGVGLMIAGNYMPQLRSRGSLAEQPDDWQRVHRFLGWVAVLSGAALVIVWSTLPTAAAAPASEAIAVAFVVLTIGRKIASFAAPSSHPRASSSRPGE